MARTKKTDGGWAEALAALRKGEPVKVILRTPDGPEKVAKRVKGILAGKKLAIVRADNNWTPNSPHGLLAVEMNGGAMLYVVWTPGEREEVVKVTVGSFDVERLREMLASSNIADSTMRLMSYENYPEG